MARRSLSTIEYLSEWLTHGWVLSRRPFCKDSRIIYLPYLLRPPSNESGDKSVYSEANVLRILRTFTTHRCGIVDGCDDAIIITRGADRQLGDYTIC